MPRYKAMSLVLLRREVRKAGAEPRVLEALEDADGQLYQRLVATDWVPLEFAERLYAVAAPLAYAKDPLPLRRFGEAAARDNLRGVYRFIVRLLTVPALLDKSASLWGKFHDTGKVSTEMVSKRSVRFIVSQHATLGPNVRETISGWIGGAVALTGADNVRVLESGGPERRVWTITWR